jgi:VanZ family protein
MNKMLQSYFGTKWPALIWSAIVFVLLSAPSRSFHFSDERLFRIPHTDKLVHAAIFLILVVLWAYHFAKSSPRVFYKAVLTTAVLATAYGIAMEFVQLYVGRDFDVFDMVADAAGAAIGWLYAVKKISPGRNRGRNQN